MRYFVTSSKDTTLYQVSPLLNSGLDEVLEVGKVVDNINPQYSGSSARILLNFDVPEIGLISTGSEYYLNLYLAHADRIKRNQPLIVSLVSRSWDEGSGYYYQDENSLDGASWSRYSQNASWSMEGGDVLSTTESIQLSEYPMTDIRINVTSMLQPIIDSGSTLFGLMVQFPDADEADQYNKGNVKIFSRDTHTIYKPTLEIAWDNQEFVTGSLVALPSVNAKITFDNMREEYTKGEVSRINIVAREEYPTRRFNSILRYSNKYYLPQDAEFSITDTSSNLVVVPFDSYSKINCDANGSYIILNTSNLHEGRFYTIKIKVTVDGETKVIDTGMEFKVI